MWFGLLQNPQRSSVGDDFPVESDVLDAFGAGGATPLPLLSFLLLFFLPEVDDAKFAAGFDESFDVPLTEEIERLLIVEAWKYLRNLL